MSILIQHKKAHFDYEVLEELDAGIELLGFEVRSLRKKQGKLEGARVIARGGEAFIVGMSIPPYQPKNTPKDYAPDRTRRLLLTKKEIQRVADAENTKGLTIVPIMMYTKNGKIKARIAIVRGKKKHDKRETIKRRDVDREVRRELKEIGR